MLTTEIRSLVHFPNPFNFPVQTNKYRMRELHIYFIVGHIIYIISEVVNQHIH